MRIGLIAPPWIPVPPPAYGGTEAVVDGLARGLASLGHEVRLFTVGESTCPVSRSFRYRAAFEPMGDVAAELAHVLCAYETFADVDLIHDHTLAGALVSAAKPGRPPVVVTHHGLFTDDMRRIVAQASRHAATVAISHSQARSAGPVRIDAVIHHGVDLGRHRLGPGGGGYLIFVGRMSPDKGPDHAIRIARRAGWPLVLATKLRNRDERDYFEREVRPLLGPDDELIIEPGQAQRVELLRHAEALINPIHWPEPFGLVMVEALACGTPVVALAHGAAPEIVDHGRTGYLCADEEEMLAAIDAVGAIDRATCRAAAHARFSLARMAADHDRLYRRLVARGTRAVVSPTAGRLFGPRPATMARPVGPMP